MSKFITFQTLEGRVNLLILISLSLYIACTVGVAIWKNPLLELLQAGFGASVVGALADSYAVYGLFHKLGPHTDLLRRRKREIIEKVLEFVDTVVLDTEFLKKELKELEIEKYLAEISSNEEFKKKLKEELSELLLKRFKGGENLKTEILARISPSFASHPVSGILLEALKEVFFNLSTLLVEKAVDALADKVSNDGEFRNRLAENVRFLLIKAVEEHKKKLLELVEKKLNSIDDEELIRSVKRASWNELQFIRLNGAILGFLLGFSLKVLELIVLSL